MEAGQFSFFFFVRYLEYSLEELFVFYLFLMFFFNFRFLFSGFGFLLGLFFFCLGKPPFGMDLVVAMSQTTQKPYQKMARWQGVPPKKTGICSLAKKTNKTNNIFFEGFPPTKTVIF